MTVTPLLAGFLAALWRGDRPALRSRSCATGGPIHRLQARSPARAGPATAVLRRLDRVARRKLGPRLAPAMRSTKRESTPAAGWTSPGAPATSPCSASSATRPRGPSWWASPFLLLSLRRLLAAADLSFGAGFGWFAPDIDISRLGRLRQERIERDLPDFLDILSVTVRAGLGYRLSLACVFRVAGAARWGRRCCSRCARWSSAPAAGRRSRRCATATPSEGEPFSFVAAQLQAEELGVPLSDALGGIAADMRRRRRTRKPAAAPPARRRA